MSLTLLERLRTELQDKTQDELEAAIRACRRPVTPRPKAKSMTKSKSKEPMSTAKALALINKLSPEEAKMLLEQLNSMGGEVQDD